MPETCIYDLECATALGDPANIERMMKDAEALKMARVAPTLHQRAVIQSVILDFVRRNKRIVYGGHALNAAFIEKGLTPIYPSEVAVITNDLEFYSPDPIGDVRYICNRLYLDRHRYVQGKEATHSGTYTISVEFTRVCEISFVPMKVFDAMPTFPMARAPEGQIPLLGIHPSFAIIDHLRIMCDPFTSQWKLDRHLPRFLLVQEHFPLDLPSARDFRLFQQVRGASISDSAAVVCHWAATHTTVVSVADHAVSFYARAIGRESSRSLTQVTLVSANYEDDLGSLHSFLMGYAGNKKVTATEHHPFVDMLGVRTIFQIDGSAPVATLIDGRGKALPTAGRDPSHGVFVASLSYALVTSLVLKFFAETRQGLDAMARFHAQIAADLIAIRKDPNARGNPLFSDFPAAFEYLGTPRSDMSMHMEIADERRIRSAPGSMIWFTYDPKSNFVLPHRGEEEGDEDEDKKNKKKKKANDGSYFLARCDGSSIVSQKDSVLARIRAKRVPRGDLQIASSNETIGTSEEAPDVPDVPLPDIPVGAR